MLYINMETAVITTTKPLPIQSSTNTFYYFGGTNNLIGKSNIPTIYPYLSNPVVREIREDYDLLSLDDVMCHPFSFQPVLATHSKKSLFYGLFLYVYSFCNNVFWSKRVLV